MVFLETEALTNALKYYEKFLRCEDKEQNGDDLMDGPMNTDK